MQHLWNPITLSFFPSNDCPQPWRQKLSATPWEVLLAWPYLPATTLPTPRHHSAPNNGRYAIPRINPMHSCLRAFALAVSSLRKLLPGSLCLLVPSFKCLEKHSLLPHPLASLHSLPDLSSPTRSQIQPHQWQCQVLIIGLPGNSQNTAFLQRPHLTLLSKI